MFLFRGKGIVETFILSLCQQQMSVFTCVMYFNVQIFIFPQMYNQKFYSIFYQDCGLKESTKDETVLSLSWKLVSKQNLPQTVFICIFRIATNIWRSYHDLANQHKLFRNEMQFSKHMRYKDLKTCLRDRPEMSFRLFWHCATRPPPPPPTSPFITKALVLSSHNPWDTLTP